MSKKRNFSNIGARGIIKHVYEEGREKTTHVKKRRQITANKNKKKIEAVAAVLRPASFQATAKYVNMETYELPARYDKTRLVLIVKDPFWVYAYWEILDDTLASLKRTLTQEQMGGAKIVLRMYDVTLIDFNGTNANSWFDIEVGDNTDSWYIKLWRDAVSYIGDLGLRTGDGSFYPLARSNCVHTPRASYSPRTEQIMMKVEDNKPSAPYVVTQLDTVGAKRDVGKPAATSAKRKKIFYIREDELRQYYAALSKPLRDIISRRLSSVYGLEYSKYGFVLEGDSELERQKILSRLPKGYFLKRLLVGSSEELVLLGLGASENFAGKGSEFVQEKIKQQSFFFELQAELIVYGRTEPDAKVELADKEVKLRKDGTFTLRFALPDGKVALEFKATSHDKTQKRRVNAEVQRKTDYPVQEAASD